MNPLSFNPFGPAHKVAIIGAGIAGLCTAEQLTSKAPGLQVDVYCQDSKPGLRGSGNLQGAIYPLLQASKSVIAQFFSQAFVHATNYYPYLTALGIEFEHQWCGVLQQAINPEQQRKFPEVAKLWPQLCAYIDAEQSSKTANIELSYNSLFFPQGGWLSPVQLCEALVNYLTRQRNVGFYNNWNADASPNQTGDGWQIGGQFYDTLIIASGMESTLLADLHSEWLRPVKGQVSTLPTMPEISQLKTVLCHKGYITPNSTLGQCFGATFEKDRVDEQISQQATEANINQLQEVYSRHSWANRITINDVASNKAGIRATSPDHIPLVGPILNRRWLQQSIDPNSGKFRRNFDGKYPGQAQYLLTGLGARGLTSAPLCADILSDLILHRSTELCQTTQNVVSVQRHAIRAIKRRQSIIAD